jgi:hypothetical protein
VSSILASNAAKKKNGLLTRSSPSVCEGMEQYRSLGSIRHGNMRIYISVIS